MSTISELFSWLFWIGGIALAFQYLIVPLAVYAFSASPGHYSFEPIEWEHFVADRSEKYLLLLGELENLGFHH